MVAARADAPAEAFQAGRDLDEALGVAGEARASLALLLAAGGDTRIWPDPITGRNRYGTRTRPAPDEISFASTTANTVSAAGFAAAGRALDGLLGRDFGARLPIEPWFDQIRAQIIALFGSPGCQAILTASGTDAEVVAVALIAGLQRRPLTNILVAPDETGSGVPLAAAGRHFLGFTALGEIATAGTAIDGLSGIEVRNVAVRDANGAARDPDAIDVEAATVVEQELRRGRDVLLHILDTSKTGIAGVSRDAARRLAACAPNRIRVLVDACQLRCSPAQVKRDLADGFMVIVTGSKFAGGPPFSGALLLPGALANELAGEVSLPQGLAHYSAALDWPGALRAGLGASLTSHANIGLGLRWVAALDGIASLAAIGDDLQSTILEHFARAVRSRAQDLDCIETLDEGRQPSLRASSIIPLIIREPNGSFAPTAQAQHIHAALRDRADGPACHVGQAVRLGDRTVLRIAASANDIAGVAARMSAGCDLEQAFRPVARDLDVLFAKWSRIARDGGRH